MKNATVKSVAAAVVSLLIGCHLPVNAASKYLPRIPPGYVGKTVLHIEYGSAPDKIRVNRGEPGPDGSEPASADNLQVVGNGFYLVDISGRVKRYRSPGILVWETQSMRGLRDYAVAPDGRLYAIWSGGRFSCFDARGSLVWTKVRDEVVSEGKLAEFGLPSTLPGFYAVKGWTIHGLVVTVGGWNDRGQAVNIAILLDSEGRLVRALSGALVGSDGIVYSSTQDGQRVDPLPPLLIGKDLKGDVQRKVQMDFGARRAFYMAGNPSLGPTLPDPTGGFAVHAYADLPDDTVINSRTQLRAEEVMWRFDLRGDVREEWRFIRSVFRHEKEIVIGPDGCVYHLEFGEKGLEVVKYAKAKAK